MEKKFVILDSQTPGLSENDKKTINLINKDPVPLQDLIIENAAKTYFTTKSSLSRLAKRLKFGSYLKMRLYVKEQYTKYHDHPINDSDNLMDRVHNLESYYIYAISQTIKNIDKKNLRDICHVIDKAKRIFVYATGASFHAASDFSRNLQMLRKQANAYKDLSYAILELASLDARDVVILFSHSGKTKEVLFLLEQCNSLKLRTIIISSNEKLRSKGNYFLSSQCICKEKPIIPISSKPAQFILTDAIFQELYFMNKDNKKYEQQSKKIMNDWRSYK
ncbi:MurR/RpiR family transcriptional regulator [[Mycoplasma] testudinis]|uniref:MurR/RpiR family transcriptional regulator n=1 Tax=[Mycoplasma] testudinis TaxID=33924 RepID=UPI00146F96AC|nr:MurR/RpiR family transcriptional regulator [[Mycoplasma] testudinis]